MAIDIDKVNSLREKYKVIPEALQEMERWCGYKIVDIVDEKTGELIKRKLPFNAVSGRLAKSNDSSTWTDFETAIMGVVIYNFDGLGIMLGDGVTGIDLDNHPDSTTGIPPLTEEQFRKWGQEAVEYMDSYAEWSPSGTGVHILCRGTIPGGKNKSHKVVDGLRRDVEMYSRTRFFTVTGNVIRESDFPDRSEKLAAFWKKYVDDSDEMAAMRRESPYVPSVPSSLSDSEVIEKACAAKNGSEFSALMNGNMSAYNDDHSNADLAFCNMLAFWCNGDIAQMDRIFRGTALMREKWDRPMKDSTYGRITMDMAVANLRSGYQIKGTYDTYNAIDSSITSTEEDGDGPEMTIDDDGEPIFRIPVIKDKKYTLDDVGNAERLYDLFGGLFHYNSKSKYFLYWTGKTWIVDSLGVINKYMIKMSELMNNDLTPLYDELNKAIEQGNDDKEKSLTAKIKEVTKNIRYVRSSKGMKAIKEIFATIKDIGSDPTMYNTQEYLLNTDSGVVDLRNGEIGKFDKTLLMSMNTHCEVSYEPPKKWLEFLEQIFVRGEGNTSKDKEETRQIIDLVQQIVGLALTGYTREQKLFILYGYGSNGKSTFINTIKKIMGDYAHKVDSSVLLAKDSASNSNVMFSLAQLVGKRLIITSETDDNERMSEKTVKDITGDDIITARELYGKGFEYLPQFNVFMCTNNLPIIRGTDYGIWRRIFVIPFVHTFKDEEKDPDMPRKLQEEMPSILGWCIQGYRKYCDNGARLIMPDCIKEVISVYKEDMDVVSRFLAKCCVTDDEGQNRETCADVYSAYKMWAKDNTDYTMKENNFYKNLKSKGFDVIVNADGDEVYKGVALRSSIKSKMLNFSQSKSGVLTRDYDFSKKW